MGRPAGRRAGVAVGSLVTAAAVVTGLVIAPVTGTATPDPPTQAAADGAHVVREIWIDERTVDLEISSPALGGNGMVRLLLPTGWAKSAKRQWPSLYLLHGCCTDVGYRSWPEFTEVERFLAGQDVITVLPSDGMAGMYSDWWNGGGRSTPDWETFHVTEVRQILESGYRAGTERAVAGLSIGGYGAMAYAFRHPGMFGSAAAYSSSLDTLQGLTPGGIKAIVESAGLDPLALWGHELFDRSIWSAHNPADNVDALRGVRLYVSAGNGNPGPLDPPGQEYEAHEEASYWSAKSFTDRLAGHGIPATVNYYGDGTHDWAYWEREFHASWPLLAEGLGLRPTP